MTSLASSCSKLVFNRNGGTGFVEFNVNRHELSFLFPSRKVGFLHLVWVKQKGTLPVSASASLSRSTQVDMEAIEEQGQVTYESKTVHVKFMLQKKCLFGEQFLIVGDDPMLGLWDPLSAIPMEWSDGHFWTVELDIPTGKAVQFKFILKGITGNVLWQPGPDRVLQTWETKYNIVVLEDWEAAENQKITDEKPLPDRGEVLTSNSGLPIVAENLTLQDEQETVISADEEKPSPSSKEKEIADKIPPLQESTMAMVADNISNPTQNPSIVDVGTSKKNSSVEDEVVGYNDRVVVKSESTSLQENPVTYVVDPVLLPGLSPISTVSSDEIVSSEASTNDEGEISIGFNASLEDSEVQNLKLPEHEETIQVFNDQVQLDKDMEQEVVDNNDEVQLDKDMEQEVLAKEENSIQPEPNGYRFVEKDIQWGRKTFQKLLISLGLL
ncbi:hypothetical protein K2173_000167 [Erythroxylum novogranatense]|uniref:CBM20 domain-containing protein n=1 Tax=Erythroxylum novogranatense TaxID=1862640 RepID=A0AAV8SNX8_9ROSI|nr:hypothetical protein K2173_000167 [Erythroxylum novogranatense]